MSQGQVIARRRANGPCVVNRSGIVQFVAMTLTFLRGNSHLIGNIIFGTVPHAITSSVPRTRSRRITERVEITPRNQTMMSHPMHLHGHHFQVVGLGNARLTGALRDTVIVPPMESVAIAFDADNPGERPLHCHNLYHMAAGMMTTLRYL